MSLPFRRVCSLILAFPLSRFCRVSLHLHCAYISTSRNHVRRALLVQEPELPQVTAKSHLFRHARRHLPGQVWAGVSTAKTFYLIRCAFPTSAAQ
jgi:hypothetical protein